MPKLRIRVEEGECQEFYKKSIGGSAFADLHYCAVIGMTEVGSIDLWTANPDYVQVVGIEVDDEYRHQGVATAMYEQAAWFAHELGVPLRSDTRRTFGSNGFWAKQLRKGRAVEVSTPYGKAFELRPGVVDLSRSPSGSLISRALPRWS